MTIESSRALAGVHVLIVEEHEASRAEWERALRSSGALVVAAPSARKALEYCAEIRFGAIVTDVMRPREDGAWLAEELRARGQHMPIVVVSGKPVQRVELLLGEVFDVSQLIDVVASVVG